MAQNFTLDHPKLDLRAFSAFVALLRLESATIDTTGSSSDRATPPADIIKSDDEDDDTSNASVDTDKNDEFPNFPSDDQAHFLDNMAELTANKRGGPSVAAAAIWMKEEEVEIWMAKNHDFEDEQETFFHHVADLLARVSSTNYDGKCSSTLQWK